MGLDWIPLSRPKEGFEQEFENLWRRINEADGKLARAPADSVWKRLFSPGPKFDRDAAVARFQHILVPPYADLGAPVVGTDQAADDWIRERCAAGALKLPDGSSEAEALEWFRGYFVLQLLPECDGLPVYSNGDLYEGVDRTSFRAAFLELCVDVIGNDLWLRAWGPMLAAELAEYSSELARRAERFASDRSIREVIGNRSFEYVDDDDPATRLHIVDQAARWCQFWSERGHGLEPYF